MYRNHNTHHKKKIQLLYKKQSFSRENVGCHHSNHSHQSRRDQCQKIPEYVPSFLLFYSILPLTFLLFFPFVLFPYFLFRSGNASPNLKRFVNIFSYIHGISSVFHIFFIYFFVYSCIILFYNKKRFILQKKNPCNSHSADCGAGGSVVR